jgi:hypothetical protein
MPRLAAALVLLVASLSAAPGAQAGFAPTNDEIVTAPNLSASGLGIDRQGNSLVAWDQNGPDYEVKARRLAATGALGPLLDLDPGLPGRGPVVAMAGSGRAFVAWRAPADGNPFAAGVRGRWVEPDGSLGPVLTLAVGKEGELAAAGLLAVVDPAGVATITWKNEIGMGGGQLMLRRVQPDGTLGELVPDVTGSVPTEPRIAALPDGSTLVIWRSAFIEKIVVASNLTIGTPQPISSDNLAAEPELAVDSQGNALATWRRDSESTYSVRGRVLDPAGNPVGGEVIFEPSLPGVLDNRPIASDSLDDFLVTWVRPDGDGDNVVYARPFSRLIGFTGPTQTVSDQDLSGSTALAAIDDFGTGAVAWSEFMGMTGSIPRGRTINSLGTPTGGIQELFSPRAFLSRSSSAPAAGVAAFLLETPFSGPNRTILVRRHLVPPSCADSTANVAQGKPIDAPLACTGPAIEAANVVEPPKHGSVGAFKPGPSLEYAPKPGFEGTDSFTYTALNDGGGSNVARVEIRVRKDTITPRIERFRFVKGPVKKRAARFSAKRSKPPRRSYSFVLRISEPALAAVTVERAVRGGVRRGKRCIKAKEGALGKRCTRRVKVGKVSAGAASENVTIPVPNKLAKRLARGGRFRATALATDLAGNKSKPKTITLRIQGKKKPGR